MALPDNASNLYSAGKFGDQTLVQLQAVFASSGPTITADAANTSPGVTITRDGTGQFTVKFPAGSTAHPLYLCRVLAEAGAGQFIDIESLTPSLNDGTGLGSMTVETSTTKGTAADPADGERLFFTLLVGQA